MQEILGDDTHGAVELADPPAVNVVLLEPKRGNKATVRTAAARRLPSLNGTLKRTTLELKGFKCGLF